MTATIGTLQVGGRADRVARQHAQAAAVGRHGRLEADLHREDSAHVAAQRIGNVHASFAVLIVLHHGDERSAHRETGAVQRVNEFGLAGLRMAITRLHPPRLKIQIVAARRNFAIALLARQPDLEVDRLRRAETDIAGAQHDGAIRQIETLQHRLGVRGQFFVRLPASFGGDDLHDFDFFELVLADDAARIAAVAACLAAETRRMATNFSGTSAASRIMSRTKLVTGYSAVGMR